MKKTLIGLLLVAQGTACTPAQLTGLAQDALDKAKQAQANQQNGAAQPASAPSPQPSASASAAPAASGVTGVSAAALADPYAVGRKWTYRYTTKAAGNTKVTTVTIDFLKQTGDSMSLRGTEVDDKGKQTWTADGQASKPTDDRPYLWNSIKDLVYVAYAPSGPDRTTTPDSVTVPAGTFDTNKTSVRTKNAIASSISIDAWVSPKLGLVKYDGTTVFTTAGTAQLTVELVAVQ